MKRVLVVPVLLSIFAFTGCASLPTASGSIHPDVLTRMVGPSFNGGTVVFDTTGQGEQTFEVPHELTYTEAISVTIVCPQDSGAINFSARTNDTELWDGSTASCSSNFSDKRTFTPGAPNDVEDWDLTVIADTDTKYRVIICAEDIK